MTKKETLKWRLSKLPTSEEVISLVKDKIITQEEAREILFSKETKEDQDVDSLKAEIKFLRELADKLSNRSSIVETIKYIEKPYYNYHWYKPYEVWCGNSTAIGSNTAITTTGSSTGAVYLASVSNNLSDLNNLM